MANWYGTSRSNYVQLRLDLLGALQERFDIQLISSNPLHAIISTTSEGDTPEGLLDVIHEYLEPKPDNVFVWIEIGSEKSRYLTGYATAIDHRGTILNDINLNEIYEDLPDNTTRVEY